MRASEHPPGAGRPRGLPPRPGLRFGGLPPFFLADAAPERGFQDWIDSYWARDVQELFRVERRWSFLRFMELIFTRSGGAFEATRFSAPCEVSRTTIAGYLRILEDTLVVHVVRPYSTRRATAESGCGSWAWPN